MSKLVTLLVVALVLVAAYAAYASYGSYYKTKQIDALVDIAGIDSYSIK